MSKFEIAILNYFDREDPVAEICYDRVQWAEISFKDNGFFMQFYPHPTKEYWEFPYNEAIENLKKAKEKLLKRFIEGSQLFPAPLIDVNEANRLGEEALEQILADPKAQVYPNRFNGKDIYEPSGRGARFDSESNFLGFLQVKQLKK